MSVRVEPVHVVADTARAGSGSGQPQALHGEVNGRPSLRGRRKRFLIASRRATV